MSCGASSQSNLPSAVGSVAALPFDAPGWSFRSFVRSSLASFVADAAFADQELLKFFYGPRAQLDLKAVMSPLANTAQAQAKNAALFARVLAVLGS